MLFVKNNVHVIKESGGLVLLSDPSSWLLDDMKYGMQVFTAWRRKKRLAVSLMMSKRKNTSNIYAIYSTMIVTCYLYVTFKKSPQYAKHIKLIVGWEPEGRYCQWLCTAIAPFWFSKEHHWVLIMPFWLSAYDIHHIVSWEPEGRYCSSKMFRGEPSRRALSLYKVNGNSALLVLSGTSLICNNALLALNWRHQKPIFPYVP